MKGGGGKVWERLRRGIVREGVIMGKWKIRREGWGVGEWWGSGWVVGGGWCGGGV